VVLLAGAELEPTHHVGELIERRVGTVEGSTHLRLRVRDLVTAPLHQKLDALLGRHAAEVKTERENDPRRAMHAPKEHADLGVSFAPT